MIDSIWKHLLYFWIWQDSKDFTWNRQSFLADVSTLGDQKNYIWETLLSIQGKGVEEKIYAI